MNSQNPDNLVPRVANLETLMQYMAETQRQLSANQQVLTTIVQNQQAEIQELKEMWKRHDETVVVMQGQIKLLLEKLLGST
ncbi:MAG: hypothetical protein ACK421_12840 [Pseudanabaenaceae cyanobacterium]